ncbi:hypothetical protein [uncultured Paraglaciecola sp.]|uniref:hypothetical protein n=1 Tax=uncultured Paraglaciecola sp. TaxID=1765024 RepID=UPI002608BCB1|nr:hypothetical protein [uncultured Paraglaciecola sp.]
MTQENKDEGTQEETTVDPIETKAREMGWRPKEEFDGDVTDWRDAQAFVDRAPLYDAISSTKRELKSVRATMQAMQEHNNKLAEGLNKADEAGYKRAMSELRSERREAMKEQDLDKVDEIEDRIDELKEQRDQAVKIEAPQVPEVPAEFRKVYDDWNRRNTWYEENPKLAREADAYGRSLIESGYTVPEVLEEVEKTIRAKNPALNRNPERDKASAVGTGDTTQKSSKGTKFRALTDEEETVSRRFAKTGMMTREAYIKQLAELEGVQL